MELPIPRPPLAQHLLLLALSLTLGLVLGLVELRGEEKLLLPGGDGAARDLGSNLAWDGTTLAACAEYTGPGKTGSRTAVYTWQREGAAWSPPQRIEQVNHQVGDGWGASLAVEGDLLAVGAPDAEVRGVVLAGKVHLYQRRGTTWAEVATLEPEEPTASGQFGYAVALRQGRVYVGSPGALAGEPTRQGAVYVYAKGKAGAGPWAPQAVLTSGQPRQSNSFGAALAFAGEDLLVADPEAIINRTMSHGALSVFRREGGMEWVQIQRLTLGRGKLGARFGDGLVATQNHFVVRAALMTDSTAGALLVFSRGVNGLFTESATISATDPQASRRRSLTKRIAMGDGWIAVIYAANAHAKREGQSDLITVYTPGQGGAGWVPMAQVGADDGLEGHAAVGTIARTWSGLAGSGGLLFSGSPTVNISARASTGAVFVFDPASLPADHPIPPAPPAPTETAPAPPLPPPVVKEEPPVPPVALPAGTRREEGAYTRLSAADVSADDEFGAALAFGPGGLLAVGAPRAAVGGLGGRGAVYLYRGETRALVQKLVERGSDTLQHLGEAIAFGQDFLAVSAPGRQRVSIFMRDGTGPEVAWQLATTLEPEIGGRAFGQTLAADGDTLAVGDTNGVYLYQRNPASPTGWEYRKRVTLRGPGGHACPVALAGDLLLAGSGEQGGAVLCARDQGGDNAWGRIAQLKPAETRLEDELGAAVALERDLALVGAPGAGRGYLFARDRDGWSLLKTLAAPDGREGGRYGATVALGAGRVAIGAPGEAGARGAVYIYGQATGGYGNWGLAAHWTPPQPQPQDEFGASLALGETQLVVGNRLPWVGTRNLPDKDAPVLDARALPALPLEPAPPELAPSQVALSPVPSPLPNPKFTLASSSVLPVPAGAGPLFGESLALSPTGALLAVGDPGTVATATLGQVHLYEMARDGGAWSRMALLRPSPQAESGLRLNYGQRLAVGRHGLVTAGAGGAEVWVPQDSTRQKWQRLPWPENASLPATTSFGAALATHGDFLAIGAPKAAGGGVVRVYQLATGTRALTLLAEVRPPENSPGARFGSAIAWTDTALVISAPGAGTERASAGAGAVGTAFIYAPEPVDGAFSLRRELLPMEREASGSFGEGLALAGDMLAVGIPRRAMLDLRRPGRVQAGQGAVALYGQDRLGPGRWGPGEILTLDPGGEHRNFGQVVHAAENLLLALAPGRGTPGDPYTPSLTLFTPRPDDPLRWEFAKTLTAPPEQPNKRLAGALTTSTRAAVATIEGNNGQRAGLWYFTW